MTAMLESDKRYLGELAGHASTYIQLLTTRMSEIAQADPSWEKYAQEAEFLEFKILGFSQDLSKEIKRREELEEK